MSKKHRKVETDSMFNFDSSSGLPETAYDMVNFYGTYEIQTTANTDNQYPAIAQGYNDGIIKNDCQNPTRKNKKW